MKYFLDNYLATAAAILFFIYCCYVFITTLNEFSAGYVILFLLGSMGLGYAAGRERSPRLCMSDKDKE